MDTILIIFSFSFFAYQFGSMIYSGLLPYQKLDPKGCKRIPLRISKKEFEERFRAQIKDQKWGYTGDILEDDFIYLRHHMRWTRRTVFDPTLRITIVEDEIAYKFCGTGSRAANDDSRTKPLHREFARLLQKLIELAS